MLDSDTPIGTPEDSSASSAPAAPPRRRRSASRPAGPPRIIEPAPEPAAIAPPAAEPESVEAEWSEVTEEADTPAAEPAEEAPADVPVTEPAAEVAVEVAVEEPAADEPPARPARTRRRSPRKVTPEPAASEEGSDDQPSLDDALADAIANLEHAAPAAEAEPKVERTASGRRRRTSRRAAEPVETPAEPEPGEDVATALEHLAAAIGGRGEDEPVPAAEDEAGSPDAAESDDENDDDNDEYRSNENDETEDGDEDSGPRRRRRRRGGRRRRKGSDGEDDDSTDGDDQAATDGEAVGDSANADNGDAAEVPGDETDADPSGPSRRRRRRRRRGEDTSADSEDGVDVVVKVREPRRTRSTASAEDEITGIEGSTRMEAKRQRRREGRAAGRRRAPVLSEAEFLARRESVDRQMLIRQTDEYTQIGVLEDGVLSEHYVDRDSSASLIGNIYLGRVQNVLPSMEAAFIDLGRGRNAVIYAGEVDWDSFGVTGDDRKVEKVLKSGQAILVQVTKDPVGAKGARLTAHISIPGRYVVYCPGGQLSGISRKLPDAERQRLKGILDEAVGDDASVIVRTAAEGATEEELTRDVSRLRAQWEMIEKKKSGSAPQALYAEPDLTVRIVRDLFTEDFSSLIVDGNGQGADAWETIEAYVTHVAPHLAERLRRWDRETEGDVFEKFRVHEQVSKALERKVHLPSGGSLVIDRTEAMTVIDVNTGKFTGTQGNLEATVTRNNLEAAEEVVRQLRLRDIGGIIVIDFIDMVLPANRELLLRRLVECLGRDRTRHQVAEVTSLGLVQMTRKKIGTGLAEAFTVACETCTGRGYHIHEDPVPTQAPADGGESVKRSGRRGRG